MDDYQRVPHDGPNGHDEPDDFCDGDCQVCKSCPCMSEAECEECDGCEK